MKLLMKKKSYILMGVILPALVIDVYKRQVRHIVEDRLLKIANGERDFRF